MCEEHEENGNFRLLELRLNYAWSYFESAAKQRMLFLNYFLIAFGILASAYGFALKEEIYPVAIFISIFGIIISIGFIVFDIRMLAFVERALKILETLERQEIFRDGCFYSKISEGTRHQLGLARIEPDIQKSGQLSFKTGHGFTKTKLWVRLIEGAAGICFVAGLNYAIILQIIKLFHLYP